MCLISLCVYGHRKHPRVGKAFESIARFTKRSFQLVYVEEPGTQPENVNRALSKAKGRFICLHDNDAEQLQENWIDSLVSTLEENPDVGLVGPIQIQKESVASRWFEDRDRMLEEQFPTRLVDAMNIPTTVVVFDRERSGGLHFDEAIPGSINGSDIDFCLQVHYLSLRVVLDTRVVYLHPEKLLAADVLYDRGLGSIEDLRKECFEQGEFVRKKWAAIENREFRSRLRLLDEIGPPEAHLCGVECHPDRFGKAVIRESPYLGFDPDDRTR